MQYIFGHFNIRDDSICWKIFVLELTNFFHTPKFFVGVWEIGDCAVQRAALNLPWHPQIHKTTPNITVTVSASPYECIQLKCMHITPVYSLSFVFGCEIRMALTLVVATLPETCLPLWQWQVMLACFCVVTPDLFS